MSYYQIGQKVQHNDGRVGHVMREHECSVLVKVINADYHLREWPKSETHPVTTNGHVLYVPTDFTEEEYENSSFARLVIDDGLGICRICGVGEIELEKPCKGPKESTNV